MIRASRRIALALTFSAGALRAQAPSVSKVEPPNWWANHSINPVRVLVRGAHLAGARASCAPLVCGAVTVNAAGTYAMLDVRIAPTIKPGDYPITLTTAQGSAKAPFTVSAQLPTMGRFQGFSNDDVIYLIMPDRFANGDTTNDRTKKSPGILDRTKRRWYHGGDLAGVRKQLPYLKSLGITALWMTPVYDQNDGEDTKEVYDGQTSTGYHGYGAVDFYNVDEHLGTLAELRALTDEAHAMGIKLVMDMVANHTGPYHPWVKDAPTPTWFHGTEAQHPNNDWQTWTLRDQAANLAMTKTVLDGWFVNILPDLNQDDPEVAKYIIQNTLWWAGVSGIDAIRQDTWQYVPVKFWRDWMAAIKKQYPKMNVVGEVLDGDPAHIAYFEGTHVTPDGVKTGVDYMFDFPMHFVMREAFARGGSLREVVKMLSRDFLYANPNAMVTLLGLHDEPRFMGERGATVAGLKLAYTLLLTNRGTPMLYYGDEIAMPGGGDPDNRRDFPGGWPGDATNAFTPAGRTADQQSVWTHIQTLLQLRAKTPALRTGKIEHLLATEQQFVYRRGTVVVAINNANTPATVTLPVPAIGSDVLKACASLSGTALTIPARSSCVFVP
ncbi:MAG: cyclomaltodextrinase N-terminal domain-containing protein [Gemmatimonadaceae bacterium]|nr:cyclomaltodextrinase N-terminal domain-containing protein [Gemmatimonadaceae bacterium]